MKMFLHHPVRTVAELIGVDSNFLKLEAVIFYTKFIDDNYAYNPYIYVWFVCIAVIIKIRL